MHQTIVSAFPYRISSQLKSPLELEGFARYQGQAMPSLVRGYRMSVGRLENI
jgi:hypothetical protein